jgi:hypothetical protein
MFERIKFWQEERAIHTPWAGRKTKYEDEQYAGELFCLNEKRRRHSDSELITKARRKFVPIPPMSQKDGFWEEHEEGDWFLTEKGRIHLYREIRAEKNVRRDRIVGWISPFSNIIIALIGALAGYFLGKFSR